MGVLVSKPAKPHKSQTKSRARNCSGSSLTKKPQLFKSLSKKKDETPQKSTALQPSMKIENQSSPSQEVIAVNEQVVQYSATLADKATTQTAVTVDETAINETASKIADEILEASVEQTQKEEFAEPKVTEPTESVAEAPLEQVPDLTEAVQQQSESEAIVEANEVAEEIENTVEASPSDDQRAEGEALNVDSATSGVIEGDNDANPNAQEGEPKVIPAEPVEQSEGAVAEA